MQKPAPSDRAPTEQVDPEQLVQAFEAAWQRALAGGDRPDLASFLSRTAEDGQTDAQSSLHEIDQTYRKAITQLQRRAQTMTVDFSAQTDVPPEGAAPATLDYGQAQVAETQPPADGQRQQDDLAFNLREQRRNPGASPQPRVGDYEILGVLGHGGMGVVYKARHVRLGRLVALKMISAGAHASPEQVRRFLIESQAIAQLQHPNIIQLYEMREEGGIPYFALEYVDGKNLARKLGGKAQPLAEAALMVETLARAMAFAHDNGIIHRDLKPGNILLTSDGIPKIADFGLAKQIGDTSHHTKTGSLMGTPSYMSPEQARGDNKAMGPLTDVYSLGAILYEMLTGRPPFMAGSPMDTVMKVLREEPLNPSLLRHGLARDLETICLKCLSKEPEKRYQSAAALANDLQRFQAGESIQARPVTKLQRGWRWSRRNPLLAGLAASIALLLLLTAVGASVAAWRIDQARRLEAQARQEADANAKLASEQAGLALDTLSSLLTATRTHLKDSPGSQGLKQAFARDALAKLDRIAPGVERTQLADFHKAEAHRFLGTIYLELGRINEAQQNFAMSLNILQALHAAGPDEKVSRGLPVAQSALGDVCLLRGDRAASREHYQQALLQRQQLFGLNPQSERAKVDLATSLVKLANVSEATEAEGSYDAALRLRKQLAAAQPGNASSVRDVWIVYNHLGDLSLRGRPDVAINHYRDGMNQAEQLLRMNPKSPVGKQAVAISKEKMGIASGRLPDQQTRAKEYFAEALALLQPLARDDPENLSLQAILVLVLARAGALEEAATKAVELREMAPAYANNLYNVACCYSLCLASLDADKAGTPEQRKQLVAAGLDALQEAIKQGFANQSKLRTDPDLDALRKEPGFQTLLGARPSS